MNQMDKITDIISNLFEVPKEKVTLQSVKDDFELWDSLGQLNLIMELEAAFGISIALEDIAKIDSVRAILDTVEKSVK